MTVPFTSNLCLGLLLDKPGQRQREGTDHRRGAPIRDELKMRRKDGVESAFVMGKAVKKSRSDHRKSIQSKQSWQNQMGAESPWQSAPRGGGLTRVD